MIHNFNRDGVHGPGGRHSEAGPRLWPRMRWMGDYSLVDVRLVEPALLAFLAKEPNTAMRSWSGWITSGWAGSIPAHLPDSEKLEEIGLVKSDWDSEETQGPPRRVYVLTEEGLAALQRAEKSLKDTRQKIDSLLTTISEEK